MHVVLIGPESTGKSTLAKQLAQHFDGVAVPEYARQYVENLSAPYTYTDVLHIARVQLSQWYNHLHHQWVFFDTDLIITKIWLLDRYHSCPDWINTAIRLCQPDLYLVCQPDLPFVDDPVRENGNRRQELQQLYLNEILSLGTPYALVSGTDTDRLHSALSAIRLTIDS
jgi:nicotinamide riboside kinase